MTPEEILKKDEQYMRLALLEAEQAEREGEVPIGAVIVCHDRIIARAHNETEKLHDVTAHAEMLAITSATFRAMSSVFTHIIFLLFSKIQYFHPCSSRNLL